MISLFYAAKKSMSSYVHPACDVSQKLIEILTAGGDLDKIARTALEFYEANQDKPFNIYLFNKPDYYGGGSYSIIRLCMIHAPQLLSIILNNPHTQKISLHDWREVYHCLGAASTKPDIYQTLITYYKPRLPSLPIENTKPYSTSILSDTGIIRFHFKNYPSQEIWRLFIDGEKQRTEIGWLHYEIREPKFMRGMLNGFQFIKDTMTEPLTVAWLKCLHRACSNGVKKLETQHAPGEFRNMAPINFGIEFNFNASLRGLMELIDNCHTNTNSYSVEEDHIHLNAVSQEEIHKNIEKIINEYNENILLQTRPKNCLQWIVKLISNLERAHPFGDANCRTICILLLNRELMKNGFSPVILEDPNRFDGYSNAELCNEIIVGMRRFQEVKSGVTKNLGLSTADVQEILKNFCSTKKLRDKYHYFFKQPCKRSYKDEEVDITASEMANSSFGRACKLYTYKNVSC